MAQKAQFVVTAGRSFIQELPATGLIIRNQDTGNEYHIKPDGTGGIEVSKTNNGTGAQVAIHPMPASKIIIL